MNRFCYHGIVFNDKNPDFCIIGHAVPPQCRSNVILQFNPNRSFVALPESLPIPIPPLKMAWCPGPEGDSAPAASFCLSMMNRIPARLFSKNIIGSKAIYLRSFSRQVLSVDGSLDEIF
jgi:hypothetical protein